MAPLVLAEGIGVGVEVGHPVPGAGIGHPPVGVGFRSQRQSLLCHLRRAEPVATRADGVVGVLVADHPVAPVEHQPPVLGRDAEHLGQRQQRKVGGHLGEIGLPVGGHGGDEVAGPPVDLFLQPGDRPGGEGPVEQASQPGVLRRVEVEHHPPDEGQRLGCRRVADLGGAQLGGEHLRDGAARP